MTYFGISFLVLIATFAIAGGYSNCNAESSIGTIESVEISECVDAESRCILHRNSNATVKLNFKLKENVQKVKAIVHGVVLDVPVPFNLPNPDGCVDSGLTCPLQSGGTYSYETTLPVLKKYPRVTVDVKWQLQNEADADIICVLIPAKIQ